MASHGGEVIVYVLSGIVVSLLGLLIVRYPKASYAIRTGWKHDDVSLSSRGRTDQRLMGGVVILIGVGLILTGTI